MQQGFAVDLIFFSNIKLQDTMLDDLTTDKITNIFKEIDTDNDGFISRQDFQNSPYAITLFQQTPNSLNAFNSFHDGRINLKDFTLLVHGSRFKLQDIAIAKFEAEKYLNKYLNVSAPGEAAPNLKQSYIRLTANTNAGDNAKLHSLGFEFGVDKPHQEAKIKQINEAVGHNLHQVFLLIKFKTTKNGQEIADKLKQLVQNLIDIVKGIAPQLENSFTALKVVAKYANNYVYLIVEVDNPFIDGLIDFATEVVQAVSPQCALKLKTKISSNLSELLTENFDYSKSGGEVLVEFDIDHVTMKKLKDIIGDNVNEGESTPLNQLITLLLQEVKLSAEFSNLGEALTSALHVDINQLPKIHHHVAGVKQLGLKDTVGQFHEAGPQLLNLINQSSEAEGEFSINLHDFFLKVTFDVNINNAFELLG